MSDVDLSPAKSDRKVSSVTGTIPHSFFIIQEEPLSAKPGNPWIDTKPPLHFTNLKTPVEELKEEYSKLALKYALLQENDGLYKSPTDTIPYPNHPEQCNEAETTKEKPKPYTWIYIPNKEIKTSNNSLISCPPFLKGKILRIAGDLDKSLHWSYSIDYKALYAIAGEPAPSVMGTTINTRLIKGTWCKPIDLSFTVSYLGEEVFQPEDVLAYKWDNDRGVVINTIYYPISDLTPAVKTSMKVDLWRELLWQAIELMVLVDGHKTLVWAPSINFGKTAIEEDGCHCHLCMHKVGNYCYQCYCCCDSHSTSVGKVVVTAPRRGLISFYHSTEEMARHDSDEDHSAIMGEIIHKANTESQLRLNHGGDPRAITQLVLGKPQLMVGRIAHYYMYQQLLIERPEDTIIQRRLDRLKKAFAQEILIYMVASCIGEARHIVKIPEYRSGANKRKPKHDFAKAIFNIAGDIAREPSWLAVRPLIKLFGVEEVLLGLREIFLDYDWSSHSGFGGPAWGKLTEHALLLAQGKISPGIFIDITVSMVHNGGWAFNKWYEGSPSCCEKHRQMRRLSDNLLMDILNTKAEDTTVLWAKHCPPKGLPSPRSIKVQDIKANQLWESLSARRGSR